MSVIAWFYKNYAINSLLSYGALKYNYPQILNQIILVIQNLLESIEDLHVSYILKKNKERANKPLAS